MSTSDTGLLDQATERAARWIAGRSSRRSLLGRIGDAALERATRRAPNPPPPPPAAKALFDQDLPAPAPAPAASDSLNAQPLIERLSVQSSVEREVPEPAADDEAGEPGSAVVDVDLPDDAGAAAAAISRHRFPDGSATAVLAPADPLLLAVAAPVAAVLGAPLLIGTSLATQPELERLNATRVVAVGIDAGTEQLGAPGQSPHEISIAAAQFVRAEAGTVRAFAIADTDAARAIAGAVAAAAALRKFPVMIGAEAARSGALEGARRAAVTYLVGKDVIVEAARVPGGFPLPAPTDGDIANRLAQLLKADGVKPAAAAKATADPVRNAVLAAAGGVVLNDLPDDAADPTVTTRYR